MKLIIVYEYSNGHLKKTQRFNINLIKKTAYHKKIFHVSTLLTFQFWKKKQHGIWMRKTIPKLLKIGSESQAIIATIIPFAFDTYIKWLDWN